MGFALAYNQDIFRRGGEAQGFSVELCFEEMCDMLHFFLARRVLRLGMEGAWHLSRELRRVVGLWRRRYFPAAIAVLPAGR